MSEIIQTKSGKYVIFDKSGNVIGMSDTDDYGPWDDSNFDYGFDEDEYEIERGNMTEPGGFNDNFEELEMPDKKRGIEVKNFPLFG